MQDTRTPSDLHWPAATRSIEPTRLSWLLAENELEAKRKRLFPTAQEEEQMLLMRHPVPTPKAFALFGMLLGTFPPAAILISLLGDAISRPYFPPGGWLILLCINLICCLAGRYFGFKVSRMISAIERDSWILMLFESLVIGFLWALGTGSAGGLLVFGIGALAGATFATPVGILAFGLFVPLHRLLARGGMIEASHFWPLACGVTMVITAAILGM